MGTTIEALLCPKKGARGFGVLIHFIGSEKRLATSCHISLNLLRTHAFVISARSFSLASLFFPQYFINSLTLCEAFLILFPFRQAVVCNLATLRRNCNDSSDFE